MQWRDDKSLINKLPEGKLYKAAMSLAEVYINIMENYNYTQLIIRYFQYY
jgi:hypothetical protein